MDTVIIRPGVHVAEEKERSQYLSALAGVRHLILSTCNQLLWVATSPDAFRTGFYWSCMPLVY